MNCEILSTLYIRSNGDIPCNDDAGEKIILGNVTANSSGWDAVSLFQNSNYEKIRDSLRDGVAPWPDTCSRCAFFRPNEPFVDLLAKRTIHKLQVEPSLACNLRCPCCSNLAQVRTRPRPFRMSLELFEATLSGLRGAIFDVVEIEYCGQGEPLLNPDFPQFIRLAREYFPDTKQRLITNGNFSYWKATGGNRLDEIFVSCDGVHQRSYQQYRRNGNVDVAIQFMRDVPRSIGGKSQVLVWKYILFEFNDSDAEIYAAQKLAQEIEVDTMLFVFTHSRYRSQRYSANNAASFPVHFPNVITNATPVHYQDSELPNLTLCSVEDAFIDDDKWLKIRGWAVSHEGITAVRLAVDGQVIGYARVGLPRPDILATYAGFSELNSGFDFAGPLPGQVPDKPVIDVTVLTPQGPLKTVRQVCRRSSDKARSATPSI